MYNYDSVGQVPVGITCNFVFTRCYMKNSVIKPVAS